MGVSVAEGTVVEWRKQPGDPVAADEPLCVISTDKIDADVPAPADGTLAEILVAEGETVAVGTAIARLEIGVPEGEAHDDAPQDAPAPASGGASWGATPRTSVSRTCWPAARACRWISPIA